jgi:hypothetical protein
MESNNAYIPVFTPDGYKVNLNVAVNTVDELMKLLDDIRAAGLLPREPGITEGEERETIAVCVRRAGGDGTPIVDFYPEWSHNGKFGGFKYAHMYLNSAEDVAQFEAQSGLKLASMPLYEGQIAITRKHGSVNKYEVPVTRRFDIARKKVGANDNGMPKYEYRYFMPVTAQPTPPVSANGNGHQAAAPWATITVLGKAFADVKTATGKEDLTKEHFVRVCGIKSAGDMNEWSAKFTGAAAVVEHAVKELTATLNFEEKRSDANVPF